MPSLTGAAYHETLSRDSTVTATLLLAHRVVAFMNALCPVLAGSQRVSLCLSLPESMQGSSALRPPG